MDGKQRYIDDLSPGTIIAFKLPDGRVKSAKVTKKSSANKIAEVKTEYGAEYIIPFDSIVWVKTGKRWPKGVYNLLKGKSANE